MKSADGAVLTKAVSTPENQCRSFTPFNFIKFPFVRKLPELSPASVGHITQPLHHNCKQLLQLKIYPVSSSRRSLLEYFAIFRHSSRLTQSDNYELHPICNINCTTCLITVLLEIH